MTTIQETPEQLTIKSFSQRRRLIVGLALLLFGLLILSAILFRLIRVTTLVSDSLTELPRLAQIEEVPSPGEVMVSLGYRGVRLATHGPRPIIGLGVLSLFAAGVILSRYKRGQVITFKKSDRQIILVESDQAHKTQPEQYPFEAISDVRIERDRSFTGKGDQVYTVQLEIDLNDPTEQGSDFVYKKQVLLSRFKHSRAWAQEMVEKIESIIE